MLASLHHQLLNLLSGDFFVSSKILNILKFIFIKKFIRVEALAWSKFKFHVEEHLKYIN